MKRAVRTLIQIVAVGLMIFGLLEIGLEFAHHEVQVRHHVSPVHVNLWRYFLGAVLLVVGTVLFAGSDSLADQLTDDDDDEN